jgi:hypothetical protein
MLVPDKYQLWQGHATPINFSPPRADAASPESVTSVFAAKLQSLGVEAIDLYPGFKAVQFGGEETHLLYREHDTHWTDRGIQVAVGIVAAQLQREP